MKVGLIKSLFIAIAVFAVSALNAQQITLDDLMKDQTETVRTSKQWIMDFSAATEASVAKEILKTELTKLEKSKHWIALHSDGEVAVDFSFQTSKKMYLDKVLRDLKAAGFTLANSKIETDSRTYTYSKNGVTVEILALVTETSTDAVYLVTLL